MKVGIVIQARTGSNRYPRKIYEQIGNRNTLQRVLGAATASKVPHHIILAMPEYDKQEFINRATAGEFICCTDKRFNTFFGHPDDLLERYFNAARQYHLDVIVRVTGDCPLLQSTIVDEMLLDYLKRGINTFMGNNHIVSTAPYPDGTDIEIFPYWMLAEAHIKAITAYDREHVCPFMYSGRYPVEQFLNKKPNTMISMKHPDISFDTKEDYELIRKIVAIYEACGDFNQALNAVD